MQKSMKNLYKPILERTICDKLKKNPINLIQSSSTQADSLSKLELKKILLDKMQKSGSFLNDDKHLDLYNALMNSIGLDEAIEKRDLDLAHDKKRRRRNVNGKETVEEPVLEVAIDVEEPILDDVVNDANQPQDDVDPKKDKSIWFKQPPRLETPDAEWKKELNANDGPK
ncbi:hypothetical protein Tco_0902956 [Tanacetum coccineum]